MEKGKLFSKKNAVLAAMIVALGAAIWLNMKYSSAGLDAASNGSDTKYLGEAMYVDNMSGEAKETSAGVASDYFTTAAADREKSRKESIELLEDAIADVKLTSSEKSSAVSELAAITKRKEAETAIESMIKAKGFEKAFVVIGTDNVSVVVKSDHDLLDSETMQITDAVTSQTEVKLENIKIVTLK